MHAVYAESANAENPLSGLRIGDLDVPEQPGWEKVLVKAASLNHHDLFTLKGVGITEDAMPMVLGCDGAGVLADGSEVIIHSVISSDDWRADETFDPKRSLLTEKYPGTMAEHVWVPKRNLIPKPDFLSFSEAAVLPVAWLTAYRMLFTVSGAKPGSTIVVQGATGGVSTALISLAAATGFQVWVATEDEDKAEFARSVGAHQVFSRSERLPHRVDTVFDSVGQATWEHSLKSLNPAGTLVSCGATSGSPAATDLNRLFFLQLRILGSTMGTTTELNNLVQLLGTTGLRPTIGAQYSFDQAEQAFTDMHEGKTRGKIVLTQQ